MASATHEYSPPVSLSKHGHILDHIARLGLLEVSSEQSSQMLCVMLAFPHLPYKCVPLYTCLSITVYDLPILCLLSL